jgi:hypothetical protein
MIILEDVFSDALLVEKYSRCLHVIQDSRGVGIAGVLIILQSNTIYSPHRFKQTLYNGKRD